VNRQNISSLRIISPNSTPSTVNSKGSLDEDHDGSGNGDCCTSESTALETRCTADEDGQGCLCASCASRGCVHGGGGDGADNVDGGDWDLGGYAGSNDGDGGIKAGGGWELALGPGSNGCAVNGDPLSSVAGDGSGTPVTVGEGSWVPGVDALACGSRRLGGWVAGGGLNSVRGRSAGDWWGNRAGSWGKKHAGDGAGALGNWVGDGRVVLCGGEAGEEESRCGKRELHCDLFESCKSECALVTSECKNECE